MIDRRASVAALLALAGCSTAPPRRAPPKTLVWPPPPDPPRFIYEGVLRNERSLLDPSRVDAMRDLIVGEDPGKASFSKPMSVAARRGRVYVTDTEGRRIFVFDMPRRRTFSFGLRLEGELRKPMGIAIDPLGSVYVADITARRVVVYDELGMYRREIRHDAEWVRPSAVAANADGSRVYVVDTGGVSTDSHRVWVHDASGQPVQAIGRRGSEPGEFNLPADVAVDAAGRVYVLDAGNFRVQVFDPEGRFLHQFGSVGAGLGQFGRPRGLAVDREGLVYVSDAAFCNVQVFLPDGTLLLAIGGRAEADGPGRYLLPAKVAADETGRIYVVDQYLHKVEVVRKLPVPAGPPAPG